MIDGTNDGEEVTAREEASLDAIIARYGGDYNRPPDITPIEEMWAGITAAQRAPARTRMPAAWMLAAASITILATGVVIGRAVGPHAAAPAGQEAVAARSAAKSPVEAPVVKPAAESLAPDSRVAAVGPTNNEATIVKAVHSLPRSRQTLPGDVRADGATYQLATLRHFTEVETLLTSYSSTNHDAKTDAQLASWSRDLLSQTRILLDSPAAADPGRRKLLQDLELVLVEMSQLSPETAPVNRDLIDGAVHQSDVITRLRSAVPAGGAMHLKELD